MDMKASMGSFAAALKDKDVWVMNVVPQDGPNSLKIIYDRGLIGTVHDWCESFSTYPRTYDLIHAWTIFSSIEKRGCGAEDLLLEIDRILRPTGFVIIRDSPSILELVKKYLPALHWEPVAAVDPEPGSDQEDAEAALLIQKKLWVVDQSRKNLR
ncbi:putative methyltransferase PMT1 [Platanthera zijinensis]|uniref:Methyltransferase n=1 Tax=Platanthera zijinensis TaxID=2320716 RepID=A0AAP0BPA8_9ASPA